MVERRILIAGGSGFIGCALAKRLSGMGHNITIATRRKLKTPYEQVTWKSLHAQERFDVIINLAGISIAGKRWSETYKEKLLDSRLGTTKTLVDFTQQSGKAPEVFINASAIGFYGSQGADILTESSAPESCFSHQLCKQWEETLAPLKTNSTIRTCVTRLGVVLDKKGGAFAQMALPFKCKVAMKNGNGEQWFSWIALEDAVSAFIWLIDHKEARGTYNLTAPTPLTNKEFTQVLKRHFGGWVNASLPAWVIKKAFGEMGDELLLASQRVIPEKLLAEHFAFRANTVEEWLDN